jgi:hypothetical protein
MRIPLPLSTLATPLRVAARPSGVKERVLRYGRLIVSGALKCAKLCVMK